MSGNSFPKWLSDFSIPQAGSESSRGSTFLPVLAFSVIFTLAKAVGSMIFKNFNIQFANFLIQFFSHVRVKIAKKEAHPWVPGAGWQQNVRRGGKWGGDEGTEPDSSGEQTPPCQGMAPRVTLAFLEKEVPSVTI